MYKESQKKNESEMVKIKPKNENKFWYFSNNVIDSKPSLGESAEMVTNHSAVKNRKFHFLWAEYFFSLEDNAIKFKRISNFNWWTFFLSGKMYSYRQILAIGRNQKLIRKNVFFSSFNFLCR